MSLPSSIPVAKPAMRAILPQSGLAIVKSVLSGDTVVLTGRSTSPGQQPPVVTFTFERVTAPRYVYLFSNIIVGSMTLS